MNNGEMCMKGVNDKKLFLKLETKTISHGTIASAQNFLFLSFYKSEIVTS